jgi:hypothetical protein
MNADEAQMNAEQQGGFRASFERRLSLSRVHSVFSAFICVSSAFIRVQEILARIEQNA